jgi:hypothetical protein
MKAYSTSVESVAPFLLRSVTLKIMIVTVGLMSKSQTLVVNVATIPMTLVTVKIMIVMEPWMKVYSTLVALVDLSR